MLEQTNLIRWISNALGHPQLHRMVAEPKELVFPMSGGGGGSSPPPPSPEERDLTAAQTEATKQQTEVARQQLALATSAQKEQEAYLPFVYEDLDLTRTLDPVTGEVTFSREGEGPERRREIQTLQEQRSLKALKGELDVSPALEQDISVRSRQLHERLRRDLGEGYQTSTPGIQALQEFGAYTDSLREGERRAEMTTAEALALNRQQGNQDNTLNSIGTLNEPRRSAAALLGVAGGGFGQAGNTAAQGAAGLRQDRNMVFQGRLAGAANRGSLIGGGIGAIGAIGAGALIGF